MKYFLFTFVATLPAFYGQSQTHDWSFGLGGTSTETVQAITHGTQGATVVTGVFGSQNLDFDPGVGEALRSPQGGYDIFLASYDDDALQWIKTLPGDEFNSPYDLAVADNGDILVTGGFNGVVNFNPDGSYELDAGTGADAFVARYDSDGNFISAFAIEGEDGTSGFAIELDQDQNIYLAGSLTDSADFDPSGSSVYIKNDPSGIFLAKYSPTGDYLWAFGVSGTGGTDVKDIEVNESGDVVLTGLFQQTVDLNPGAGADNYTAEGVDSYVMKVDENGVYQWGRVFTGNNNQITFGTSMDFQDNVYVCGKFISEIDLDPTAGTEIIPSPTSATAFVTKLNASGEYQWGRYIANLGDGRFMDVQAGLENIHLAGVFNGTITLPDSSTAFSTGGGDILYAEFTSDGTFEEHFMFGGGSDDEIVTGGSLMDHFGATFGGHHYGTIDFGPNAETLTGPTSHGNQDLFLVSYMFDVLSVSNIKVNEAVIYPNPAQEYATVKMEGGWSAFTLLDTSGRIVSSGSNTDSNRIDVSELTNGMYILQITNDERDTSFGRFIKG